MRAEDSRSPKWAPLQHGSGATQDTGGALATLVQGDVQLGLKSLDFLEGWFVEDI